MSTETGSNRRSGQIQMRSAAKQLSHPLPQLSNQHSHGNQSSKKSGKAPCICIYTLHKGGLLTSSCASGIDTSEQFLKQNTPSGVCS